MNPVRFKMPLENSTILSDLYDHMTYADVILTCSDSEAAHKPVAHKWVLSNCSDFLKGLLEGNLDSHELIIPDLTTSVMVRILQLLYTGEVRVQTQDQIFEVVEGIQLLGINSAVNSIQFGRETVQSVIDDELSLIPEEESHQNWPTSELISPVSLEDSSYSTDSNDIAGPLDASEIVISNEDFVQIHQPVLSKTVPVKSPKTPTNDNSHSQIQRPDNGNKVKRGVLKRKRMVPISGQGSNKARRTNVPVLHDSLIEYKTEHGNIFLPSCDQLNKLVFLDGHGHDHETEQGNLLCEEGLTTDVTLHDHSYAFNRIS